MTTRQGTLGRYVAWFLAALSIGAGVIHFAVAGGHFDVAWWHGSFFAVVGWLQLSWAAAIIVRPDTRLLGLAAIGNLGVIAVWFVSRVWGIPFGPDAGVAEPVTLADALATGLQVGIVVVSVTVLTRPVITQRVIRPSLGLASLGVTALAIAVVSTMALSPSFASDHHGHSQGDAAADDAHTDDPHADGAPDDHAELAAAEDSTGDSDGHADGDHHDGHTGYAIEADGTSACEQSGYANEGNSGHGHRGPVPYTPLTSEEREIFAEQVRQANEVVATYPTVADAEAAGYRRVTPYVPCIAAHYINNEYLANGEFDPGAPEILLYDGTDPDRQIVGLSYLQFSDTEPEGFAGDNDPWHVHEFLCLGAGGVLGDESTSEEECEARGGQLVDLGNLWMMHMWNVPGWESRWGLFSSEHPDLGGRVGDING
jgi:hypothetical protein